MVLLISPMPGNIEFAIIALAFAYALTALTIQRKISNPRKMREIQAKMKVITTELKGVKDPNVMKAKQEELMPLIKESTQMQMKSMFIVLPMFFAVYYGAIPFLFSGFAAESAVFIVPLSYSSLFILCAVITGFTTSMALMVRDRVIMKKNSTVNLVQQN